MADVKTRRAPTHAHPGQEDSRFQRPVCQDQDESMDELAESSDPMEESGGTKSADSDDEPVDESVLEDIQRFEDSFKGITKRYRLLNRIGEGTFSTVYKAEDLEYDCHVNDWDIEDQENRPMSVSGKNKKQAKQKSHFVAIKKIYVTSSPIRIMNELALLHDLRHSNSVCPLITAFRHQDQVIAVLPYYRHQDFRGYFRDMTVNDMRMYMQSLFTALAAVHEKDILHRDIKPTNFLYDQGRKEGVLVDFGLAERQGTDNQPCACQLDTTDRNRRYIQSHHYLHERSSHSRDRPKGFPKDDRRPCLRANRAGTRGFRAPEVLFKCTAQSTKIDVWSAGVILLTILSKRFPFFQSSDDIDAVIEMTTIFGKTRMAKAALLHGQIFETDLPTVTANGYSLEKIVLWATDRKLKTRHGERTKVEWDESWAIDFMNRCLDLDPTQRISAEQALRHPFLRASEPLPSGTDPDSMLIDQA